MTSMTPYTIEKMAISDIEDIMGIERTSFPTPWSRTAFVAELTISHVSFPLVVRTVGDQEEAPKLVGYCISWFVHKEIHILNIAVHKQFRRKGIGEMMVAFIQEWARKRGVEKVFLEVRISNFAAIRLYQKQGFKIAGRRKQFYQDTGEDAYTMVLDLKNQPNQKECRQKG